MFNSVYLFITSQCNLRCPYCFLNKQNSVISKETIEKTINYLIKTAQSINKDYIKITFFGGEPTLYPDLCQYTIEYAFEKCKDLNITPKFSMITNGMRFDDEVKNFLLKWKELSGRIQVQLSYDGIPEVQRVNRVAYKNEFDSGDRMLQNLEEIKKFCEENNIPQNCFNIHSMISKKSLPHLFETIKFFTEQNFYCHIALIPEEAWDKEDMKLFDEQYEKIFEYYKEHKPQYLKTKNFGYNSATKSFRGHSTLINCGSGRGLCAVTPEEDIYACHRAAYQYDNCKIGYFDGDEAILNITKLNDYLKLKDDPACANCNSKTCRICKYFAYSNEDGKIHLENLTGYCDMVKVETKYCSMAKRYLEQQGMV